MPKEGFHITGREWAFVGIMILLSLMFDNKWFISLISPLNPVLSFLIYYAIVLSALAIMAYFGFIAFGIKISNPFQIIGSVFVLFSFFLIFNWENPYVQYVSTGAFQGASNVFYGSEDGVTWYLWSFIFHPIESSPIRIFLNWIFTFPITVGIVTLIGVILANLRKINFSA